MSADSSEVWSQFAKNALLWLVPALIALPFYLILLLISMVAGEGTLLEATDGVSGGINCALGPLLILVGFVAVGLTIQFGTDASYYVEGIFFAIISVGLGIVLARRALIALRKA